MIPLDRALTPTVMPTNTSVHNCNAIIIWILDSGILAQLRRVEPEFPAIRQTTASASPLLLKMLLNIGKMILCLL